MKRFLFAIVLMSLTIPLLAGPATLEPTDSAVIRVEEPTAADVVDVLCGEKTAAELSPFFQSNRDVIAPLAGTTCGSWRYAGCCYANTRLKQTRNCQWGAEYWTETRCTGTCYY